MSLCLRGGRPSRVLSSDAMRPDRGRFCFFLRRGTACRARQTYLARFRPLIAAFVLLLILSPFTTRAQQASPSQAASSDPILQAMREELDRSKSKLKMENVPAPYYIEYRLSDVEQYSAEAAFGALREEQRVHTRIVRVVVRVGDYKQDSYIGPEWASPRSARLTMTRRRCAGSCGPQLIRHIRPPTRRWP